MAAEDRRPRPPPQQQRVEGTEQTGRREFRGRRPTGEVDRPVRALVEVGSDRGQPAADVAQRQPGPAGEVAVGGGTVPGEVATGEPGERDVAVDRRGGTPEPVADEDERMLAAHHRPADGDPAQSGQPEDVHEGLPRHRDPGRPDPLAQLRPGQRPDVGQRPLDHRDAALGGGRRHALLAEPAGVAGGQRWGRQSMQPPVVVRTDQVQGPAVEPGDHQRTVGAERSVDVGRGQAGGARADREPRAARVLGLDGEQSFGDCDRVRCRWAGE